MVVKGAKLVTYISVFAAVVSSSVVAIAIVAASIVFSAVVSIAVISAAIVSASVVSATVARSAARAIASAASVIAASHRAGVRLFHLIGRLPAVLGKDDVDLTSLQLVAVKSVDGRFGLAAVVELDEGKSTRPFVEEVLFDNTTQGTVLVHGRMLTRWVGQEKKAAPT